MAPEELRNQTYLHANCRVSACVSLQLLAKHGLPQHTVINFCALCLHPFAKWLETRHALSHEIQTDAPYGFLLPSHDSIPEWNLLFVQFQKVTKVDALSPHLQIALGEVQKASAAQGPMLLF